MRVRSFVREIGMGRFSDPAGRASLATWAKGRDDNSRSAICIVVMSDGHVDVPLLRDILGDKISKDPRVFVRIARNLLGEVS